MQKNNILSFIGLARRASKIAFGTEQVNEAIEKNKVKLVIVALDTSDKSKERIKRACESKEIPMIEFGTIDEISNAIGQDNKSVIGILDNGFARELQNKIGEFNEETRN